jgi:hypothetical protein
MLHGRDKRIWWMMMFSHFKMELALQDEGEMTFGVGI